MIFKVLFALGFVAAVGDLPLLLMDKNSNIESTLESLQDLKAGEELRKIQFRGKIFQESIKIVLKRLNDIGALD